MCVLNPDFATRLWSQDVGSGLSHLAIRTGLGVYTWVLNSDEAVFLQRGTISNIAEFTGADKTVQNNTVIQTGPKIVSPLSTDPHGQIPTVCCRHWVCKYRLQGKIWIPYFEAGSYACASFTTPRGKRDTSSLKFAEKTVLPYMTRRGGRNRNFDASQVACKEINEIFSLL